MDSEFNGVFCVAMAIWSTVFVETWKKRERALLFDWDLEIVKFKDQGNVRREFKCVSVYDSDINETTKLDSVNSSYRRYAHYLFVLFMFAVNTFACMATEGYWDVEDEQPFVDAAYALGSPAMAQFHQEAGTASINSAVKSIAAAANDRSAHVSRLKGFSSSLLKDVAEERAEEWYEWTNLRGLALFLIIKVLEEVYGYMNNWFVEWRNFQHQQEH